VYASTERGILSVDANIESAILAGVKISPVSAYSKNETFSVYPYLDNATLSGSA